MRAGASGAAWLCKVSEDRARRLPAGGLQSSRETVLFRNLSPPLGPALPSAPGDRRDLPVQPRHADGGGPGRSRRPSDL